MRRVKALSPAPQTRGCGVSWSARRSMLGRPLGRDLVCSSASGVVPSCAGMQQRLGLLQLDCHARGAASLVGASMWVPADSAGQARPSIASLCAGARPCLPPGRLGCAGAAGRAQRAQILRARAQTKAASVKADLMTRLGNALKQRDAAREEALLAAAKLAKLQEDLDAGLLAPAAPPAAAATAAAPPAAATPPGADAGAAARPATPALRAGALRARRQAAHFCHRRAPGRAHRRTPTGARGRAIRFPGRGRHPRARARRRAGRAAVPGGHAGARAQVHGHARNLAAAPRRARPRRRQRRAAAAAGRAGAAHALGRAAGRRPGRRGRAARPGPGERRPRRGGVGGAVGRGPAAARAVRAAAAAAARAAQRRPGEAARVHQRCARGRHRPNPKPILHGMACRRGAGRPLRRRRPGAAARRPAAARAAQRAWTARRAGEGSSARGLCEPGAKPTRGPG